MSLHLFPNLLGQDLDHTLFFPRSIDLAVQTIQGMIAESDKGARLFLKNFKKHVPITLLNDDVDFLLEPVYKGEHWGFVSDAGLPCLADPGHLLVRKAHERKIPVYTYPGPSSLLYALILSGLPAQRFSFHGYIAKDPEGRAKELKKWELERGVSHLFIEAPYRNMHTYESCLATLNDKTLLCIAWNLTTPDQGIITAPIAYWKKRGVPPIQKIPTTFILYN